MALGWPWPILRQGQIWSHAFIWGKLLESHLMEETYSKWPVTKGLCLYKNSAAKGLSAPAQGLYTCMKRWKIMYKIRLQRCFFWNWQQMGKVTRLFCWHHDFVHKGLSAPVLGLYTCGKTLKNVYKIRIQRDLFETCNKWSKWLGLSVEIKSLSPRSFCPCPGAIYNH